MNKKITHSGVEWPDLIPGTLIKRYKRFLADIRLKNGETVTTHCPNSGTMKECSEPGRPVFISQSNNPKRKLKYTWEIIEMPTSLVGVNTLIPNRLVKTSIANKLVAELNNYDTIKSEIAINNNN
jgi:sugar fermentation stimulation protein A